MPRKRSRESNPRGKNYQNWDGDKSLIDFRQYLTFEKGLAPLSVESYLQDVRQLLDFKRKNPELALLELPENYLKSLFSSHHSSSVSRKITTLKSYFDFLKSKGSLRENPFSNTHSPKIKRKLPKFLDMDQTTRLFKYINDGHTVSLRNKAILELLYSSGL